jgi:hypothetical protein
VIAERVACLGERDLRADGVIFLKDIIKVSRERDNAHILCGVWQTMRTYSEACGKNALMFPGVWQTMRSCFVACCKYALIFCGVSQKFAHVRSNNIYFLTLTTCARNMSLFSAHGRLQL